MRRKLPRHEGYFWPLVGGFIVGYLIVWVIVKLAS